MSCCTTPPAHSPLACDAQQVGSAAPWQGPPAAPSVTAPAAQPDADAAATAAMLAQLRAEVSRYANAVDRVRDLVRALRVASVGSPDEPDVELYWPHLLEVLEEALPRE